MVVSRIIRQTASLRPLAIRAETLRHFGNRIWATLAPRTGVSAIEDGTQCRLC